MGKVADILKTVHEIFNDGDVAVQLDAHGLGMAYAIPKGEEDRVVEIYGPWHDSDVKQVFYQESALVRSVLAEFQLIIRWRYSEAQQYIIEVYFTNHVIVLDPTASAKVRIRFDNPRPYDFELEAYEIPFFVEVIFDPVGGNSTTNYNGVIRADGTGRFDRE
ncbi:hypothetical protein [Pseudomonas chlororaphis]|uniref:hypothetical protein n=1 Tax=Pseudomonas chlororaphis TaxID=587753 RepID=UPI000D0ED4FE|nr:hypothetical protein [Pseudomonas chlororaphis]AVO59529.1 hypothetical protein C6Q18_16690 [Pseudomonas chlororaphis subsp. piscium]